jgi:hypothetical protein
MTELELLQQVSAKIDTATKEGKELKECIDKQVTEHKALEAKVTALNAEFGDIKGATVKDLIDEVKELKAKAGRPQFALGTASGRMQLVGEISKLIGENKAAIEASGPGKLINPVEVKAVGVITDSNFTGTNAPYRGYLDWQPGMEPTGQFRFRSLVRTINSGLDNVSFPRANTPVGEGSFGKQATQTATKAQVDRDHTMIDVVCKPMAGYSIVSRASLRNIIFLQSWLPVSMMEQLEDTEDLEFANALVAAATGSASTTGITSGGSTLVKTLVAIIKNQIQAKFNPGTIVADPNVWANAILNVETNAGFNLPNVVTVDAQGNTRVLGRVIQPVNWLTGGRILAGDWSKAGIVQSEGLTMRQSDSHAEIFTTNQIAFLLERIEALATFRPDAFTTAVIA